MTLADIGIRLFVATLIGCLIGLNRFAHHRFIGVRTLGPVSLGAAALVVAALDTGSIAPIIGELRGAGLTTLRELAAGLNARGVTTPRGGAWQAATAQRVLHALG